ncbi:retrovirus-related Pol polyprotein from transposon 17.6 [Trichonephila clavipes]|nr:retrovirus-related Pol polyprotein from transposon 17.6 [Trichonephila clavipes]
MRKETSQVQYVQPKVDLEPLKYVIVYINGKAINCILDSGTQIFICNSDTFPDSSNDEFGKITLSSAFGENVEAKLIKTAIALDNNSLNHPMDCLVAITDKLNADALIPPALYESLCSINDKNNKKENEIFAESADSSITFSNDENEAECGKDIFYVESDSDNIHFNSDYTKMKDEPNTYDSLEKVRAETGIPSIIASDQGTNFKSALTQEFTKRIGSSPRFSCPGYPASNGLVERWNKVLKDMIHHVIREDPRSWDRKLPFLLFAYREVPNTTTGVSPFRLLYGREARGQLAILKSSWAGEIHLPTNISQSAADYLQEMKINMEKAAESASLTAAQKQKAYGDYFNKRSSVKNFSIEEQFVLLIPDSSNKIYARWTGPGEIIQHHPPHSYKIKLSDGTVRHVHVNKIRKYHPRALAVGVIFEGDHEFGEIHPTPNLSKSTSERVLHEINLNHLKETKVGTHRIRLKPNIERKKPFVLYRIPESLKIKVDEQIEELLRLDLIEESDAEIAYPIVCVNKKDGTLRLCVDFRALNSESVSDDFPMEDAVELIHSIGRANIITTLDLLKGYWAISMAEDSKNLTSFKTHRQQYHFKCAFGKAQIKYLGHIISSGKHEPDPEKTAVINNLPVPKTKELRSVLGLCNYYREYIPKYSELVYPLTELTKKRVPDSIPWTEKHDSSFHLLKKALVEAPSLYSPVPDKPYTIHSDASQIGIAACLSQNVVISVTQLLMQVKN